MRKIARAKAQQMVRAPSPTPSLQALDQISEEERAEIVKYVETEEVQVSLSSINNRLRMTWYFSLLISTVGV